MKTPTSLAPEKDQTNEPARNGADRNRRQLIAKQPFFKGLSPAQLELLADDALDVAFAPGEKIFEEGSPANRFFLILEGEVELDLEQGEGKRSHIQTLGPGDDLGWSWILPPYYLHFNARAITPTKAIFFYGTRLRERCEQDHDLGYQLMKRVAEVMLQRLQATRKKLSACVAKDGSAKGH